MKILHYALGFPPYRSGGLTKFCIDLMVQQVKENHEVALLWPGEMRISNKKTVVRKRKNQNMQGQCIQSFEIINPLPVPFDEGIVEIAAFTRDTGKEAYVSMLDFFQPDVIHIHTLMGLHKSFLSAAKDRGVRLIFTAHDFFPICPKVTMFYQGEICRSARSCEECNRCNTTALSVKKIQILQSPLYRSLKDTRIVKKLRKRHRDDYLSESSENDMHQPCGNANDYLTLRQYYFSLLQYMDIIHYNSNVTKKVYECFFEFANKCVLSITHGDIHDNRKIKHFSEDKLRIRYLGAMSGAKGFFLLKEALDKLWEKRQNFRLDLHFMPTEMAPYIEVHERYSYSELEAVFDETDILVVPSVWYETFGFTALEALSYGVPVIISGTVGAQDILAEGAGIIIENITSDKLFRVLDGLTLENLEAMNQLIVEKQLILQLEDMSKQIAKECYKW